MFFAIYFVTILITSNIVSTKIVNLWGFVFDGGTLLFPLSYIIGDVLTEVYGYARTRSLIWTGMMCQLLLSLVIIGVGLLPSDASRPLQQSYMDILWFAPRIIIASIIAYLIGEFINSYLLAKIKIATHGTKLWLRTIWSTIIGQWLDTIIFVLIAFWVVFDTSTIIALIVSNYILKVSIEIIFTPVTYRVIAKVKAYEWIDHYDTDTDFSPWKL